MPEVFIVDAFADAPFRGNAAAVCLLDAPANEVWMQSVAAEMNLSETAFVTPDFGLRWFTPLVEVDLCGHATLATAHILFEKNKMDSVSFSSKSGPLTCSRDGESIAMDFPATPPKESIVPDGLLSALGITSVVYCGMSRFDYLLELSDEQAVRDVNPNFEALKSLPVRGIVVTSRGKDYDFVSRFFAPSAGVNEDPVTGSAHCALTPFWVGKLGENRLKAFQASRRGGSLGVELVGDRVKLIGKAVTVVRGHLTG